MRSSEAPLTAPRRPVDAASPGDPEVGAIDFEDVFVQSGVGMALVGGDGRFLRVNDALCELVRRPAHDIVGARPIDLTPDDLRGEVEKVIDEVRSGAQHLRQTIRHDRPDGTTVWLSVDFFRVCVGEARRTLWVVHYQDVTEQRRAEKELETSARQFRALILNISDTVSLVDSEGRLIMTTGDMAPRLGYPAEFWRDRSTFDLAHPDDLPVIVDGLAAALANPGVEISGQVRARHAEGHWEHVEVTGVNLLDDPEVSGIVVTTRNITQMKQAQQLAVGQSRALELIARGASIGETLDAIRAMVEEHGDGATTVVFFFDGDQMVLRSGTLPGALRESMSRRALASFLDEFGRGILTRQPVFVSDVATDALTAPMADQLAAAGIRSMWSVPVTDSSTGGVVGTFLTLLDHHRPPTPHDREMIDAAARLVAIALERVETEARLAHQASHDSLTGLPNRTLLLDRLEQAVHRANRSGQPVAVMFLDVDRFKVVNDSLGHSVGDQLLVAFAERLRSAVRSEDTVARFGGDEFVVLCEEPGDEAAGRLLGERIIAAMDAAFRLADGSEVYLTISIGLAISAEHHRPAETLLRDADAAMYRAKERGRRRLVVFDDEMRASAVLRLSVENDLRRALERNEFSLRYQPTVDLRSGLIVGAEVLVRWDHPYRGLLEPGDFIPLAEETGLIVPVGLWVLEHAVAGASAALGGPPHNGFELAVNLSARQLAVPELASMVADVLERHQWPADMLCLELTETALTDDGEPTSQALMGLKALGLHLAIDDFGTGYSSLTRLHRLPVDVVKVDQSFVSGLDRPDPDRVAIVTAVIRMVHALGLKTAAEGIETPKQLAHLRRLDCDWGQGFLFSPPLAVEDFGRLLAEHPAW